MPRRILLAIVAMLLLFGIAGAAADRWARARATPEERASQMVRAGKIEGAERLYWSRLREGPVTVPLLIAFLDAHERAADAEVPTGDPDARTGMRMARPAAIDEAEIDALLARRDLDPNVALLGRFWRGVARGEVDPDLAKEVERAADAEPPAPWANHLLAEEHLRSGHADDAAVRLIREGSRFRERAADASEALAMWAARDEWDRIDRALADPRVEAVAPAWVSLRSAVRAREWPRAAHAFFRALRPPLTVGTLLLASLASLAWGTFCAQLGGVGARPRLRVPLYLAAFTLGVASVSLTLVVVELEEVFLKMNESGNPLRDALFFTFGVGLREEVSKLVFFLPLLPLLRSKRLGATRLDVLVCGALVGLGFAAEENLNYLHGGDLSTAMARFLTANFLHMSMTAILAGALDDMVRDGDAGTMRFSQWLLGVAAMHGAYDFCLSSRAYGDISFFAMAVFLLLARQFLVLVSHARAKERAARVRLLETFGVGMAVVIGGSYVYASALVGPGPAAQALAEGLLGLGIIIVLFVQELRRV